MFSLSNTLIWAVLTGPADWVCHIGTLTPCIEAVAQSCFIVTWWSGPGGIQTLSERPTGFLQCFDTVGLVIWPVKIVSDMTYNVLSGTLNLAQSINQFILRDMLSLYLVDGFEWKMADIRHVSGHCWKCFYCAAWNASVD